MTKLFSTRQLDSELVAMAAQHNTILHAEDFIAISYLNNPALTKIIDDIDVKEQLVLFTSSNAVKAFVALGYSRQMNFSMACVGENAAAIAGNYFPNATLVCTAQSAAQLALKLTTLEHPWRKASFFCGNLRRNILPENLRTNGWLVNEIVVYETTFTPKKINEEYDGILFFSPSGVESFFGVNNATANTLLFAIGYTTAEAIAEHSINTIVVAEYPDKTQLLLAACNHLQRR